MRPRSTHQVGASVITVVLSATFTLHFNDLKRLSSERSAMSVNPVPEQYRGVIAYLIVQGASDAIRFYTEIFGAEEFMRLAAPDGSIGHAELRMAGGVVMLADEVPDMDIKAPPTIGGSSVGLMVYVEDADAVFNAAIAAGATAFKPICDQFYGDRCGTVDDPFGHRWTIASRIEELSPADVTQKFQELYGD